MPHYITWSRVMGDAADPIQLEQLLSRFFAQVLKPNGEERGQIALAVDGKTLRGTLPMG